MTRSPRSFIGAPLTLALLFAACPPASAQEEAPDPRLEEARTIFEAADADFAAHRYLQAAEGFRRSYDLLREAGRETAPLVWFNVASAYDRAHRTRDAIEAYQHFVDEVQPTTEEAQTRVETARQRLVELQALVDEPDERDGGDEGREGRDDDSDVGSETDGPLETTSSGGGGISPVGPILMAGGGALVITGLILGGVALGRDGDFTSMCPDRMSCDPGLRSQWDETHTIAIAGDVLWITGALVAATGLVLTFVLTEGDEPASAALSCGPGGCSVRGTF
ncbi:MAG: hypothetical protein H6719_26840 [Sandaracinaceae bacterium]|nr:hypothetical protein [Sandaracinaceae bacterium]